MTGACFTAAGLAPRIQLLPASWQQEYWWWAQESKDNAGRNSKALLQRPDVGPKVFVTLEGPSISVKSGSS